MEFKHGYKSYFTHLGASDIAALTLIGPANGRLTSHVLNMGLDEHYRAWIVDETIQVPSHYNFECEFKSYMWVFDDDEKTQEFQSEKIKVYRAGEMGILIQLIKPTCNFEKKFIKN